MVFKILYMALKTFVKISEVTNLSDARYCAGMAVQQLGFVVDPNHASYTDPRTFQELADWVSGVAFVAEISDCNEPIKELISPYAVDAVQITRHAQIQEALGLGFPVIFEANQLIEAIDAWQESGKKLDYILLDAAGLSLEEVAVHSHEMPLVISNAFEGDEVLAWVENTSIKGIAMRGGSEIRPGYKNFDALADVLESLEGDEYA